MEDGFRCRRHSTERLAAFFQVEADGPAVVRGVSEAFPNRFTCNPLIGRPDAFVRRERSARRRENPLSRACRSETEPNDA